ncbi:MAG TPA: hypothetical protein VEB40_07275 [Flavipsychrobacter sp.]|nr:hypothetical protein [Flavipsychrobacter sp.]
MPHSCYEFVHKFYSSYTALFVTLYQFIDKLQRPPVAHSAFLPGYFPEKGNKKEIKTKQKGNVCTLHINKKELSVNKM